MPAPTTRPPIVQSLRLGLLVLGSGACVVAVVDMAAGWSAGDGQWWVMPLSSLVFLAAGLTAWWRRPSNRLGAIMVCGAAVLLLSGLGYNGNLPLASVYAALATLILALLVHQLLAFPSGRLRGGPARATALGGYVVCLILQMPLYLFDPSASPGGILAVGDFPRAHAVGSWAQRACGAAVMASAAIILAGRFRRANHPQRLVLGPLYLYGIAAVLAVPLIGSVIGPLTGMSPSVMSLLQVGVITAVPVTVVCAMLLGGFARTSEVQELGSWLGAGDAERLSLRDALARALGDPSVQLAFWAPPVDHYVDADGRAVVLPDSATGRAFVEVSVGGRRVAAIGYDAELIDDPDQVAAAGRVVALALDRERLTAELRVSRLELERSRTRILQVADRERHRIAQNLHDGLQAELVLLGVQAQGIGDIPNATADVAQEATRLRERVDQAAAGLRELVHAVMPLPLVMRGLVPAVEDLVDRMPVPTRFDPGTIGPLPEQVESTAYFIVAEALSNAVKHSRAAKIAVRLAAAGSHVSVEVHDDGVGGAAIDRGLGLGGLTDRVAALGGRLTIDSPPGQGTRLVAELPCES